MNAVCSPPAVATSRLGGLLRDLTVGLKQQMFYWGRDVMHPSGNLLVAQGFAKRKSGGLQGTSCYRFDWQGGCIELHGACAGWYGPDGGFVFVRPHGKCHAWLGTEPPVPGHWLDDRLSELGAPALYENCLPFLDWWLHSESWIGDLLGASYRIGCHRQFKKLPGSKPWLPPEAATEWLARFRENPSGLDRWKRFDHS
jgi:hypothetical protein